MAERRPGSASESDDCGLVPALPLNGCGTSTSCFFSLWLSFLTWKMGMKTASHCEAPRRPAVRLLGPGPQQVLTERKPSTSASGQQAGSPNLVPSPLYLPPLPRAGRALTHLAPATP